MPANLENPSVATVLKKISFHSNLKEGQCQRMFKLPHKLPHNFTCQECNAQNPSSQASTVHKLRMCRCTSCVQNKQRNQRSNCQYPISWISEKARKFQKNIQFCLIDYDKAFDDVDHNKLWKILKEMRMSDHLTCLLISLYAD